MRWITVSGLVGAGICAAYTHAQATCPGTDITQPSVVTVVASLTSPKTEALVVATDCTTTQAELSDRRLTFSNNLIARIASVPSETEDFECNQCPLSAGFDLRVATDSLRIVYIDGASATGVNNWIFPRSLVTLVIVSTPIESLAAIQLPASANTLRLSRTKIKSLASLPSTVEYFSLTHGQLTAIDITLPPRLKTLTLDSDPITALKQALVPSNIEEFSCQDCKITSLAGVAWPSTLNNLDLTGNPLTNLDKATLPSQLKHFNCNDCGLTSIRGVKLPRTLLSVQLVNNKVKEFEIREADVAVLKQLRIATFDATAIKSTCSDSTAEPQRVGPFKVCVISDERFEQRYVLESITTDDEPQPASGTSSASKVTSALSSTSASTASDSSEQTDANSSANNNPGASDDAAGGSGSTVESGAPASGSRGSTDNVSTTAGSSSMITVIIVITSVFVAVAAALIGYRLIARRRSDHYEAMKTGAFEESTEPTADASHPRDGASSQPWQRDIRQDASLAPYRIDLQMLQVGLPIARGGFGVIYQGTYDGQAVAIKQLAPDAWRDDAKLYGFMDEVRMCAALKHPKIVQFIGVAWGNLRDISVVIELMHGGDLYALLQKQPLPASPEDWFQPWTASKTMRSKALIAQDVAEAVVYLHSINPPVIHRDLKARNVLLDTEGNAKLSDFGISREISIDTTMTGEVGTMAWIAPEVLRGDRYSEKADIYSFGVLLVELDRCRHPYADGAEIEMSQGSAAEVSNRTGLEHQNAQVAILVGAGLLKPSVSSDSPSSVRELVSRCVQLEPSDRPSSAEVLAYIQRFAQDEGHCT